MSPKNKLRFLVCFLFSTLAHSSVLVASLFFSQQVVEDPQGATLKESAQSLMMQNSPKDQTVELVDIKQSQSAIPDSVQVAELARTLPKKNSAQREILLAKKDDPTAIEIKKQAMAIVADDTPTPEPTPKPVNKKTVKKIVKATTMVKKVAKVDKPKKTIPKKEEPAVAAPAEKEKSDTVVAQNEELTPVKDHVDAEASEEVAAPEMQPAPEPKKQAFVKALPLEEIQQETQEEPTAATMATGKTFSQQQAPKEMGTQEGLGESGEASGQGSSGASAGGGPQGIRDGDSLSELAGNIRPLYPLEDRRAKREGTAVFVARITADGKVKDIKLEGSATPAMNAVAQKAFANYHYKTGQEGWVRKKFVFKITGETEEATGLRRTSQNNATSW